MIVESCGYVEIEGLENHFVNNITVAVLENNSYRLPQLLLARQMHL